MTCIQLLAALVACAGIPGGSAAIQLDSIELPPGFMIEVYAESVPKARSLALGSSSTLFVGSRAAGDVYAVVDSDGDFKADRVHVIASGLSSPNGVALRNGSLYVAEINRILRYDDIEARLEAPPEPMVVTDSLPTEKHHGWKFIAFGPDGLLYVPVGAPCNVCLENDPRFGSILRMEPDGSNPEIFAHGVRNSVGFDWHPKTAELWFTDNGRDWLGDDLPPDELNHAPRKGLHFGFPFCFGKTVSDPDFGTQRACSELTPPAAELGAHVASLGMRFYTGSMFPPEYKGQIFVAEHGSWNRSDPVGYRITLLRLDGDRVVSYEAFAEGWLQGREAWGRPVDLEVMPDGSMLVSDDHAGAIYRISYRGN